jgi:hypothetical protein
MKRLINSGVAAFVTMTSGAIVHAHPGHGVIPPDEPAHWLEPVHLIPIVGTVAAAAMAAHLLRRGRGRDPRGPR